MSSDTPAGGEAEQISAAGPRRSILGFVGVVLAVIGTIGVCTPWILPELLGGLVLLVAFILSIVAVFRRPRWAGIVGIAISVIGTLAAGVLFVQGFVTGLTGG